MDEQFNLLIYQCKWGTQGLKKFTEPLVNALNERNKLPKYILMVPDKDFLSVAKNKEGICTSMAIGSGIYQMIRRVNFLIDKRRENLEDKKPGALINNFNPNVIWIRMLKRPKELTEPTTDNPHPIFSFRGKFNSILEDRILEDNKDDRHRLMSIDVKLDKFDRQGNLNSFGKEIFWKEVDSAIKKFNAGKISLKPRPATTTPAQQGPVQFIKRIAENHNAKSSEVKRFKLKTPPPKKTEERRRKSSNSHDRKDNHNHRHYHEHDHRRSSSSRDKSRDKSYGHEGRRKHLSHSRRSHHKY